MTWLKTSGWVASQLSLLLVLGCAATPIRERGDVSDALRERVGHGTNPASRSAEGPFPPELNFADGLSEDEAVAVALWNNPAFRSDLATLGIARAELIQAGLLRNPVLSLLFPVGPKQLEANLVWQAESIWHRRRRVSMAQLNLERVAEGLVQNGLDLAMAVKIAFADLLLAHEQAALARERADLLAEIGQIDEARLRAGDISEIQADEARGAAQRTRLDADRLAHQVGAARARLSGLLGIADDLQLELRAADSLRSVASTGAERPPTLAALLDRAWAARPDLRAAELKIEEAGKRSGLARSEYLSITAIVDYNQDGKQGSEVGPGLALTLPLFDRGQADKARAAAMLEGALHDYSDVRNRIAAQVREAHAQLVEAGEASRRFREEIVRRIGDTLQLTEKAHAAGDVSYQAVLVSRARHVEARFEQSGVAVELLRARARLERAVGSDLDRSPDAIARNH